MTQQEQIQQAREQGGYNFEPISGTIKPAQSSTGQQNNHTATVQYTPPTLQQELQTVMTPIMIISVLVITWALALLLMTGGILSGVNKTNKLLKQQAEDSKASRTSPEQTSER